MRLSDAIALGRTIIMPCEFDEEEDKRKLGKRNPLETNSGCALDMAVIAARGHGNWHDATDIWPWAMPHVLSIAVMFDTQVWRGEMTFDQLIDYVRSIEPVEAEPARTEEPCTSNLMPRFVHSVKATAT